MSAAQHPELDAFLAEFDANDPDVGLAFERVCEALDQVPAPPALRERLLEDAAKSGRLWPFAAQVAELLDLGLDKAKELLDRIDDPSAWVEELPGISFLWVEGGPRVADAVRGFVRVRAGLAFPEHEHLGDEITLVLQGGFQDLDRQQVVRPGELDRMPTGTSHGFVALDGGADLLKLAVVHKGLRAMGRSYLPR
jgi:quercetin dioxygenase-like cupin family protein